MILTLPSCATLDPTAATTQAILGLPVTIAPSRDASRKDAAAIAAIALNVPVALLATYDLAERLGLLARVKAWLEALRAQAGEGATLDLPGRGPRPLADISPGEVLDAATVGVPPSRPEDLRWDAFIIHAGRDRDTARRLWQALKVAGLNPYLDRANLKPGADWSRSLAAAMAATRVFVVVVSADWQSGWYNEDELARAVALCRQDSSRMLVPVILGPRPMPADEMPYGIAHIQSIHLGALSPADGNAAVVAVVRG